MFIENGAEVSAIIEKWPELWKDHTVMAAEFDMMVKPSQGRDSCIEKISGLCHGEG
jgi:hypothetical protein